MSKKVSESISKLHTFIGHNEAVNTVSWSPHSAVQFASGSSDRRVVVWDLEKLNDNTQDKAGSEILVRKALFSSSMGDIDRRWQT
jgi:WD40 repeat protein